MQLNTVKKTEKCKIVFIEITISFKLMSYDFYFICRTLISHIKAVKLHDGFDRSVAPLQLQIFGVNFFVAGFVNERFILLFHWGIKVHRKLGWWHACDTEKFCWTYCPMICVWRIAWNVTHTKNRNNLIRKCHQLVNNSGAADEIPSILSDSTLQWLAEWNIRETFP